jgi:cysteine dioxygenase
MQTNLVIGYLHKCKRRHVTMSFLYRLTRIAFLCFLFPLSLFRSLSIYSQLDTSSWNKAWWSRYVHTDPSALYTRNLIDTDHETYSLLLLCWNPGKESVIHDHPGDGCWVKVLDGSIRECRYRQLEDDRDDSPLYCYQDVTVGTDTVTYIDDSEGYHKIGNPEQRVAATLHLYSPPVQQCWTWKTELDLPEIACMTNYSEFGHKL